MHVLGLLYITVTFFIILGVFLRLYRKSPICMLAACIGNESVNKHKRATLFKWYLAKSSFLLSCFDLWIFLLSPCYCRWPSVIDRCVTLRRAICLSRWRSEFWDTEVSAEGSKRCLIFDFIGTCDHLKVFFNLYSSLVQTGVAKENIIQLSYMWTCPYIFAHCH